jgi:outer membrane protein with beta-barrel domain
MRGVIPMKSRFLLFAAVILLSTTSAFAIDFGVRYGQISDADEDFVGAELAMPIGAFTFNPSFEYWLIDEQPGLDATVWTVNADFNYYFNRGASISPYLGLGVGYSQLDATSSGIDFSDDEWLGNANAGLEFRVLETLNPYIQARYFRSFNSDSNEFEEGDSSDDFAFMVGLRF